MKDFDFSKENLEQLFQKATDVGNIAGDEWMANAKPVFAVYNADLITGRPIGDSLGTMLDNCGNAHIKITDKRSKLYRSCIKFGLMKNEYTATLPIYHKYRHRQEHGLALAIMRAAMKVFQDAGMTGIRIWDYID